MASLVGINSWHSRHHATRMAPACRLPRPLRPVGPCLPSKRTSDTKTAALAADAGKPSERASWDPRQLLNVFSDPKCNQKLLALCIGQMLCSIATLMHDSYLPVYVQDELGLTNTKIGAVQGAAQFLCQLSKGVSGVAGDMLGSQVRVLVFGTFLTLLCKPMFALLSSVYGVFGITACLWWFFAGKLLDRLSKGIREAPTKAVMNELARESGDSPDAAYGLRQSLTTAGMLVGSTIASVTFTLTGRSYIATFSSAAIFAAIALLWLMQNFKDELFGEKPAAKAVAAPPPSAPEPPPAPPSTPPGVVSGMSLASVDMPSEYGKDRGAAEVEAAMAAARAAELKAQGAVGVPTPGAPAAATKPLNFWEKGVALVSAFKPVYWQALIVVGILYLARFDASFLTLRAKQVMDRSLLPMLTLINTLIQVVLTAPLSRISGSSVHARNTLLLIGFIVMIACDACFALPATATPWGMVLGASLLGVHMAMTHSITVSMLASYMPVGEVPGIGKISGTAVSFTDLLLGCVLAVSNTMAGVFSDMTRAAGYGNVGCFAGGAAACGLACVALLAFSKFGDLGNEQLVVRRAKKAKAT